jgi:hypothetical protein
MSGKEIVVAPPEPTIDLLGILMPIDIWDDEDWDDYEFTQ